MRRDHRRPDYFVASSVPSRRLTALERREERERDEKARQEGIEGGKRAKDYVRRSAGLVEHRTGRKVVEKVTLRKEKSEEMEKRAKQHLAVLAELVCRRGKRREEGKESYGERR